jgi:hypothetical protein
MSGLADKAAAAADGLAKARVQSSIEWDRKTAFLSNDDIAIAQQLKSIYGQDIPAALNSSYAASIRLNSAMHEVGGIINTAFDSMAPAIRESINGTNSLADGFKKLGLTAVNALQDMIIKLTVIKPLMNAIGGGFDLSSIFGSSSASVPSSVMVGNYAMPKFAGGTSYAPGGMALVGEEGPELVNLPAGASVTPNRKTMATLQGGGTTVQANFAPTYNVTGSGPEIEKLRQQMAEDRANFEARTVAAVRNAKQGRRL